MNLFLSDNSDTLIETPSTSKNTGIEYKAPTKKIFKQQLASMQTRERVKNKSINLIFFS